MGAFLVQLNDGPTQLVPNCFHIEGLKRLWPVAFGLAAAPSFLMSLTGLNIPGSAHLDSDGRWSGWNNLRRRPDIVLTQPGETLSGNYPWYPKLRPSSTMADILNAKSHINGLYNTYNDGVHERTTFNMSSKPVTFNVDTGEFAGEIVSSTSQFANDFMASSYPYSLWTPTGDRNLQQRGYYEKDAVCAPDSHGFPYNTPKLIGGTIDCQGDVWARPHFNGFDDPQDQTWSLYWDPIMYPGPDSSWACYIGGIHYDVVSGGSTSCKIAAAYNGVPSYMYDDGPDVWIMLRPDSYTAPQMDANPWRGSSLPIRAAIIHTDEGVNSKLVASCVFADDIRLGPGGYIRITYRGLLRELIEGVDIVE
jgi:hypothetical protein